MAGRSRKRRKKKGGLAGTFIVAAAAAGITMLLTNGNPENAFVEVNERPLIMEPGEENSLELYGEAGAEEGSTDLPSAYDYREAGRSVPVKDQGALGTCWAFASLTALETSLTPGETLDFSEDHMSLNENFLLGQENGGEYTMSMAYLLSWQGPVLESQDPYGDKETVKGLKAAKHVQEIQILPERDFQAIKRAVYENGGVQSSLYTSLKDAKSRSQYYNEANSAYYYSGNADPNHDAVIVGWDDNYPKENFNEQPQGDGAFLCVNSWGEEFGQKGYFYVSYYDSNIGRSNISYTKVEENNNYQNIYQTDLCGWVGQMGYGEENAWFSNIYEARGKEVLSAAGFYAIGKDTAWEVYVAEQPEDGNGLKNKKKVAEGRFQNPGFYTVSFNEEIPLEQGQRYGIIVNIHSPGLVHPVAIEYDSGDGKCRIDLSDGEGCISQDGFKWSRAEEKQGCNICLKAYTKKR